MQHGTQHADVIDPTVLIEAFVLGGQDRLLQRLRDISDLNDGSPFFPELADEYALGAVYAERDLGLVLGKRVERRQRRIDDCRRVTDEQ